MAHDKQEMPVLMRGIVRDIVAEEVPPDSWSDGQNVYFDSGELSVRRVGGYSQYSASGAPDIEPYFAMQVQTELVVYWIEIGKGAAGQEVWVTDGSAWNNITPAGGLSDTKPGMVTGCIQNGFGVFNLGNRIDAPFWWDLNTSNPCTTLPGWQAGWTCNAIRAFKTHLHAIGMAEGGSFDVDPCRWSASAVPGMVSQEWVPTADNDAGTFPLASTEGQAIDAHVLRDGLVIAKQRALHIATYIGGLLVYQERKLFLQDGVNSVNQMVAAGGFLYLFTGEDFIQTDGQSVQSVATEKTRRYMVGIINPEQQQLVQVVNRNYRDELWVCIPATGNTLQSFAAIFNTRTGDWGFRDLPQTSHVARGIIGNEGAATAWDDVDPSVTWDNVEGIWDQPAYSSTADELMLCAHDDKKLYVVDRGNSADGQDITAFIKRESLMIGEPDRLKLLSEIWPRMIFGGTNPEIQVRVGVQDHFEDPIYWYPPITYTDDLNPQRIEQEAVGRYFSFEFKSVGGAPWKMHGFKVVLNDWGRYA